MITMAMFSDETYMELSSDDNLVLSSLFPQDLQVEGMYVKVPVAAGNNKGELVLADWQPTCGPRVTGKGYIDVALAPADSMRVKAYGKNSKLERDSKNQQGDHVMVGGPIEITATGDAAEHADVPTTVGLEIFLNYPGGRTVPVHKDPRTQLSFEPAGRFDVLGLDSRGKRQIRAASGSTVGQGTLMISFKNAPHTMNVSFELVRHKGFEVRASPWPAYRDSDQVRVQELAPIGNRSVDELWEQAISRCRMVLTNGKYPPMDPLRGSKLAFGLSEEPEWLTKTKVLTPPTNNPDGRIINPSGNALEQSMVTGLSCTFADKSSTEEEMEDITVLTTPVFVSVLEQFELRQGGGTTCRSGTVLGPEVSFRGGVGLGNIDYSARPLRGAAACSYILVELSDGRKVWWSDGMRIFLPKNPFVFSSDLPTATEINPTSGVSLLRGNTPQLVKSEYKTQAVVKVVLRDGMSESNIAGKTVSHVCNLDPVEPGDFDLCDKTMCSTQKMPINTRLNAGDTFAITVRINTDGKPLGAFDFRVTFDNDILTLDGDTTVNEVDSAIRTLQRAGKAKPQAITAVLEGPAIKIVGSCSEDSAITSQKITTGWPTKRSDWQAVAVDFVEIKFKFKQAGVSPLGGTVGVLSAADTSSIGTGLDTFNAGLLAVGTDGARRRRHIRGSESIAVAMAQHHAIQQHGVRLRHSRKSREAREWPPRDSVGETPGDADGGFYPDSESGVVDARDVLFVGKWLGQNDLCDIVESVFKHGIPKSNPAFFGEVALAKDGLLDFWDSGACCYRAPIKFECIQKSGESANCTHKCATDADVLDCNKDASTRALCTDRSTSDGYRRMASTESPQQWESFMDIDYDGLVSAKDQLLLNEAVAGKRVLYTSQFSAGGLSTPFRFQAPSSDTITDCRLQVRTTAFVVKGQAPYSVPYCAVQTRGGAGQLSGVTSWTNEDQLCESIETKLRSTNADVALTPYEDKLLFAGGCSLRNPFSCRKEAVDKVTRGSKTLEYSNGICRHPGAGGCSSDRVGPNVTISEGLSVMLLLNHPLQSFKQLLEEAIETTKAEGGRGRVTSIDAEGEAVALVEMEVLSYSTRWLANGTVAGIEMEFAADIGGFNSSIDVSMMSSTLMNAFRQPSSDSFLGESEVKHMVLAVPSSDVGALQTPKILAQTLPTELADAGLLEDSHTEGFSYEPQIFTSFAPCIDIGKVLVDPPTSDSCPFGITGLEDPWCWLLPLILLLLLCCCCAGVILLLIRNDDDILIAPYPPPQCLPPTLTPVTGLPVITVPGTTGILQSGNPTMEMTCDTEDVYIIYTVNGSDPTHEAGTPFDPLLAAKHIFLYDESAKPTIDLTTEKLTDLSSERMAEWEALKVRFRMLLLPRVNSIDGREGWSETEETSFDNAEVEVSVISRTLRSPEYHNLLRQAVQAGFELNIGSMKTGNALVAILLQEIDPLNRGTTTRGEILTKCVPHKVINSLMDTGEGVLKTVKAMAVCSKEAAFNSVVVEKQLTAKKTIGPIAFQRSETRGALSFRQAKLIHEARESGQTPPPPQNSTVKSIVDILSRFPEDVGTTVGSSVLQSLQHMTMDSLEQRLVLEGKIISGAVAMEKASLGSAGDAKRVAILQSKRDVAEKTVRTIIQELSRSALTTEIDLTCHTEGAVCWYTTDGTEPRLEWEEGVDGTMTAQPAGTTKPYKNAFSSEFKPFLVSPNPTQSSSDCTLQLRMIATCDGAVQSNVTTARFNPETVGPIRMYRAPMPSNKILLECDTEGVEIYFSLSASSDDGIYLDIDALDMRCGEGTDFDDEKQLYSSNIDTHSAGGQPSLDLESGAPLTVFAQARRAGWCASPMKTATFQAERVSQPRVEFSPLSGEVTFVCATYGAEIRFSSGASSDPFEEGTIFDGNNGPQVDVLQAQTEHIRCIVS